MEGILDIVNNSLNYNNKEIFMILDENNDPWFKAKEIAELLEYTNTNLTIRKFVIEKYKKSFEDFRGIESIPPSNVQPHTIFINELGLYALIMKSKMPSAEKFQDWVYNVIKTIRKTGEYKLKLQLSEKDITIESLERSNEIMFDTARKIINKKDKEIENMKPDFVPKTKNDKLTHYFILIKLNDEYCEYDYYVIRCQKQNLKRIIDKVKEEYQDYEELLNFYNPNSINFYNRIKENLKDKMEFHGNYFRIKDDEEFTEEELIEQILNLKN